MKTEYEYTIIISRKIRRTIWLATLSGLFLYTAKTADSDFSKQKSKSEGFQNAKNQILVCGRNGKRNRGYGRIIRPTLGISTTRKTQPLAGNAAAYFIKLSDRKRNRF